MSKHYFSKSVFALTVLTATATSGLAVQAEDIVTTPSSTATKVESTTPTSTIAEEKSNVTSTPTAITDASTATSTNTTTNNQNPQPVATEATTSDLKPIEGEKVDLRIMSTTDLHTNLVNYDYYQDKESQKIGLAKTAVLIEEAKKENPNTVLVDNGDVIQGTPLGTYKAIVKPVAENEEHPMYQAMNALGYDASTLGNHEFNYGLDYLKKIIATANLPILNANVLDFKTHQPVFKTYDIITKTFKDSTGRSVALNIGITGIVPPQILNWDKANLEGKVTVKDSVKAIEEIVPTMRAKGADVILVLSHSGIGDDRYEEGEENVGYQIASIKGVDAVVTGHSHAEFPSGNGTGFYEKYTGVDGINGKINGTPVTMAGKYGDHLGIIDLGLSYTNGKWQVSESSAKIRKIDMNSTTAPITSYFALVKDDPSVQIVNNAQRWYVANELKGTPEANLPLLSAAAPFKAGTRGDATAYTDIPAGPVAIKNVADLYLYDNVTALLKVTGADLREWLEMSAGQFNQIDPNNKAPQNIINTEYRTYNFDVIDGLTYKFDITQPNKYNKDGKVVNSQASRVRDLMYNGKPVADKQEFMIVTNNYRASGTFPGAKNATMNRLLNLENRQTIINYIISEKTINPTADNNWGFTESIKGLDLRFQTADKAKNLVTNSKDIQYIASSTKDEGFGDYRFVYTEQEKIDLTEPSHQEKLSQIEKQKIHHMVATAYTKAKASPNIAGTVYTQQKEKTLPKTGQEKQSYLAFFGVAILGLVGSLLKKKQI
ncbi:TPA: 5'-nucleotidase C-terminal domain-containing protein [Streptococcus agalactiae]|nr:5'-nucleotidase C-terminal domain-containing protein [Streptococcus agalactiae]HEO0513461.1 5'-nucleotidase C-terminal domain-containing protein [Streptococcus agalactiae]HEO1106078.1 5'-nucleotidase C-terminal domain-containing protein [Streptococcus agalactiae]HEO8242919.1 5'-nucleotidase C-terminal domain-containing protein [Streptococcus agalactiae]